MSGAAGAGVGSALAVLAVAAVVRAWLRWWGMGIAAGPEVLRWVGHVLGRIPRSGAARSDGDARAGLDQLRTSLRAGTSLVGAFERLAATGGPWSSEAVQVLGDRGTGGSLQEALDRWAQRDRDPAVGALVDAVAVAGATGASQAAALEVALEVIEERRAIEAEVHAATATQRGSAVVLVAVPVAFAVVLAVVDGRIRRLYSEDLVGWSCLLVGISFDAAGAWWLRRLVRSVR